MLKAFSTLRDAIYVEPQGKVAGYRALLAALDTGMPLPVSAFLEQLAARDEQTLTRLASETS